MWCLPRAFQLLYLVFFLLSFQANLSSCSSSKTHLCSPEEAAALLQFKTSFSINDTSPWRCDEYETQSYPRTNSWKEGLDCCKWDGVTCDDIKGHVIGLDLSCCQLYGTFPSNGTLFHLPHLQKLNLAFNDFNHSKMSCKFGEFASTLVYLNLSGSNFEGQVPSQVSHLSKLVSLDLSRNFDQTFDQHTLEGLVENLTEVRHLALDWMNMSSINPNALMNLSSSLRTLSLHYCGLRGNLPTSIFQLPNLKSLSLGGNRDLILYISQLNRSSKLEYLDLRNSNKLGSIPWSLGNLFRLSYLDLSGNSLSGQIPRSLGNLSQLSHLDLSSNSLSGPIPSSFTNLSQLEFLLISGNQLEGSIPDEVTAFPKLISLDLSSNLLGGTLPSWLYTISSLQSIFLQNNQLSDIVELDMFSKLQNLQYLDLSNNSLSLNSNGNAVDYKLPNLTSLSLRSCNVSEFPHFLRGSEGLGYLDLSSNKIHGRTPQWLWGVGKKSLWYLNLSHNSLTDFDQVPWREIEYMDLSFNLIQGVLPILPSTTGALLISNNNLSGEIPSHICNANSLQFLDLSYNNLSGIIPHCFGKMSKSLSDLNLQKNKFRGVIPPIFMKGCPLKYLNINGNQLEGPLTQSIMNCRDLEVLDLGNNKINDTFPHWLGSLPSLRVVVLRSNQLQGSIHEKRSGHSFSKLQIFDLSNNHFTGPLPVKYIKSFKAMMNLIRNESSSSYIGEDWGYTFYSHSISITLKGNNIDMEIFVMFTSIDLSDNEFEGEIPKVIGELKSLKGLNLSHNNLIGHIPTSLGNLAELESLDLSSNKLVGRIPTELTSLASLEVFNLSQNQLVGPIPQGKQFNTFGNDSYVGNLGLCGFPVSKSCDKNEAPVSAVEADSETAFEWKAALIGYGSGLVFGISAAYIMFTLGKPFWLVKVVEVGSYRWKRYLRGRRIL